MSTTHCLLDLPLELVDYVCTFLAPRDLLVLSSVCVILNRLALADAHWRPIAERLWSKRQLTRAQRLALASRQTTNWRRRYYEALRNAKRTRISKEELCEDFVWHITASWQHSRRIRSHGRYLPSGVYLGVYGEWPWHWVKKSDDDEDEPCTEEQATGVQIGPFYGFTFERRDDWGWEVAQEGIQMTSVPMPFDPPRELTTCVLLSSTFADAIPVTQ